MPYAHLLISALAEAGQDLHWALFQPLNPFPWSASRPHAVMFCPCCVSPGLSSFLWLQVTSVMSLHPQAMKLPSVHLDVRWEEKHIRGGKKSDNWIKAISVQNLDRNKVPSMRLGTKFILSRDGLCRILQVIYWASWFSAVFPVPSTTGSGCSSGRRKKGQTQRPSPQSIPAARFGARFGDHFSPSPALYAQYFAFDDLLHSGSFFLSGAQWF